ncbi:nucleotidyltransferase family protein [Bacillus cytotoxicus]|uniref:Nucleotidyltransferase family protein n=1 Tax=Bacillus cytotoxicus TaxID=580165 RepID=A0ACC6A2D3_9BACI|nr:nucleotidyltransferase family protein [Bacillus cytotoxicus]
MNNNHFTLHVECLSKELQLLLEILKMQDGDPMLSNRNELFTNIDWNVFIQLAMHHRIYPLIYIKVKEIDEKLVPAYVIQTLYQQFRKNTFQMLHLSAEMEQVSKLFTENEIRTLFLKGPILAHNLYGDISLRTSCDLDILIPIHKLEKAEALLLEKGYVKDDYIQTILNDWKWRHHHITFFHPQKQIKVEIHWRLNPGPAKEPSFEQLWERKRKSTLTGSPVYLLGSEDLFLFLVTHGARHGWSRLRWLVDINQIVRQNLNWEQINRLLKKYHYFSIGGQALILASQLLNTPIIKEIMGVTNQKQSRRLAQDTLFYFKQMVNLHADSVPEEVTIYHTRYLFSLMSNQQKFLFIMSYLYPFPIDAKTLPLPKPLHFLYFPLRPFLCFWRKTRKHALS